MFFSRAFVILGSGEELDDDVYEALTEQEEELRAYLLHGEPLSEDTIDKYTAQFWEIEPYKLVHTLTDKLYNLTLADLQASSWKVFQQQLKNCSTWPREAGSQMWQS